MNNIPMQTARYLLIENGVIDLMRVATAPTLAASEAPKAR